MPGCPSLHTEHWQDIHGRAKDLGVLWELEKGTHRARCALQGHSLCTEARVVIDGDVRRTEAFRDTKLMIDRTTLWRESFEAKAWRAR